MLYTQLRFIYTKNTWSGGGELLAKEIMWYNLSTRWSQMNNKRPVSAWANHTKHSAQKFICGSLSNPGSRKHVGDMSNIYGKGQSSRNSRMHGHYSDGATITRKWNRWRHHKTAKSFPLLFSLVQISFFSAKYLIMFQTFHILFLYPLGYSSSKYV